MTKNELQELREQLLSVIAECDSCEWTPEVASARAHAMTLFNCVAVIEADRPVSDLSAFTKQLSKLQQRVFRES